MSDFIRARSPEQKSLRMDEIKEATDSIFINGSYLDITLSNIADNLSWTRANLYRYIGSKEEVILEITTDRMVSYYDSLMNTFHAGYDGPIAEIADRWAGVIEDSIYYLKYRALLGCVVSNNVPDEMMQTYLQVYAKHSEAFAARLAEILGIHQDRALIMQSEVVYNAIGNTGPMWSQAEYRARMEDYIRMRLTCEVNSRRE